MIPNDDKLAVDAKVIDTNIQRRWVTLHLLEDEKRKLILEMSLKKTT